MKLLPLFAVGIGLTLAACGREPGPRATPGHKDRRARRERRASKAFQVLRVLQVLRGLRGRKDRKATRAIRASSGSVNVRAVEADGTVDCDSSETLVSVFCPSGGALHGAKCGHLSYNRPLLEEVTLSAERRRLN